MMKLLCMPPLLTWLYTHQWCMLQSKSHEDPGVLRTIFSSGRIRILPPLAVAMLSKLYIHQFSQMFNPENAVWQNTITSKTIWLYLFWCFCWYHKEPTEFVGCFFLLLFFFLLSTLRIFIQLYSRAGSKFISNFATSKTISPQVYLLWHTESIQSIKYETFFFSLCSCQEGSLRCSLIQQYNRHTDV